MKRTRAAREQLRHLIDAHDDSPIRLLKFTAGAVIAGAGAIGLSLAAPVAVIVFIGGIALSANEARGIADTHLTLISDDLLAKVLEELQSGVEAAMRVKGWT